MDLKRNANLLGLSRTKLCQFNRTLSADFVGQHFGTYSQVYCGGIEQKRTEIICLFPWLKRVLKIYLELFVLLHGLNNSAELCYCPCLLLSQVCVDFLLNFRYFQDPLLILLV